MNMINRRNTILSLLCAPVLLTNANAQESYPSKSVTLVVGYAAGGPADIFTRIVSRYLQNQLDTTFIVENKAGASGQIAAEYVARGPADGYRLLSTVPSLFTMVPFLSENMRVRASEFVPIGQIAESPMILVCNPELGSKNIEEFIRLVKSNQKLSFGSAGQGTLPHLATELFLSKISSKALHVPYKGSAPSLQDLASGQIAFAIDNIAPALPLIQSKKVLALAVTSSARYWKLPELPTFSEAGVDDYNVSNWFAVFAPKDTPSSILTSLNVAFQKMINTIEFQEAIKAQGALLVKADSYDTQKRLDAETKLWSQLIKKLEIKIN